MRDYAKFKQECKYCGNKFRFDLRNATFYNKRREKIYTANLISYDFDMTCPFCGKVNTLGILEDYIIGLLKPEERHYA